MANEQTSNLWNSWEIWRYEDNASLQLTTKDPLQSGRALVPRALVEKRGLGSPQLSWDAQELQQSPNLADCLWSFIKLADGSDNDIVRFAKRWGPLGICAHGMVYTHLPECTPLSHLDRWWETPEQRRAWGFGSEQPSNDRRQWHRFWEPFSAWRFYSQRFAALLGIAQRLSNNQPVEAHLWFRAFPWQLGIEYDRLVRGEPYPPYPHHEGWTQENVGKKIAKIPALERTRVLASWVREIIRDARVIPAMDWEPGELRPQLSLSFGQAPPWTPFAEDLDFEFDSLFAILTAQLVAALQHPNGLYECSICRSPMTKERKQRDGQRRYCSEECRVVGIRETKKVSAKKRRQEQQALAG